MKLKILTTVVVSLLISFVSCKKDSNQDEIDKTLIEEYVIENNLDGQFTSTGLYYQVIEPGNDFHPDLSSEITVTYTGMFLDNEVFDEGSYYTSILGNLIVGWQEGVPIIGEEGRIKLVIPSSLAYGSSGGGPIGPNECLVFDITLHYFYDK